MMSAQEIEVSVVMPCLNEEEAIGICIQKIQEVFLREKIKGEVIVADNGSTDRSRQIAESLGAKVVVEPRQGYGAAYLKGLREVAGRFIVIGDSDNSYDFRELNAFLTPLREGYDFVMGSRFKGTIKKGAMHFTNRYIGNPILSWMTRLFFHTSLSDIHCGMRAFTLVAYRTMKLKTLGMEFATEMVVSALLNNLKVCEVPVTYYPRKGESKLSPLHDAWRHIRFMLLYCPLWLYFVPGALGITFGLGALLLLARGPFFFLGHNWDIHFMALASAICILSYQVLTLGVHAHTFAIRQGFLKNDKFTLFVSQHFNLERGILLGALMAASGALILMAIFVKWLLLNFGALYKIRETLLAITLLVIGLQTIFSSFFLSILVLENSEG